MEAKDEADYVHSHILPASWHAMLCMQRVRCSISTAPYTGPAVAFSALASARLGAPSASARPCDMTRCKDSYVVYAAKRLLSDHPARHRVKYAANVCRASESLVR